MSDSCKRFFNLPELFEPLRLHLGLRDVANLASTNRTMYRICTPSLYRDLEFFDRFASLSPFSSEATLQALARNIQHVRVIHFDVEELVYYYNLVLASRDTTSNTSDTSPTRESAWLPAPVAQTSLVALPPMTHLSHLTVSSYSMEMFAAGSDRDPRVTMARLCWLISLNPYLNGLRIDFLPFQNVRNARRFATAIAGLSKLKILKLKILTKNDEWFELWSPTFFSCPPSLQRLSISCVRNASSFPLDDQSDPRSEEDYNVPAAFPRLEPLVNLEELFLFGVNRWPSAIDISSIFVHCPNVKRLDIPMIEPEHGNVAMGEYIGKECSMIESLVYRAHKSLTSNPLPLRIMDSLPAQQFTNLHYNGMITGISRASIIHTFQRHSITLQRIYIKGTISSTRIPLSMIFRECSNLVALILPYHDTTGHYITLADALEYPWVCIKLQQLNLAIDGCELPVEAPESATPYYTRSAPITLSKAEIHHFAQLERLYRQIGALTNLQHLNLQMVQVSSHQQHQSEEAIRSHMCPVFPAMLNLPSDTTVPGRPGFLHLLAGLSMLESLLGSVCAEVEETKVTMGWAEARWMEENWPLLRMADFFNHDDNMTAPFQWLVDKRMHEDQWELLLAKW